MLGINFQKPQLKELYNLFVQIPDRKTAQIILEDFLTPSELETLANRWQIVKMLDKGISQREINEKLGVGIATITHGSRQLKTKGEGFRWLLGNVKF